MESPQLTGVQETLLWPLYNRAAEARRPDARLHDPDSVRIADAIQYDYARSFGAPDFGHPLRSLLIDAALRDWLRQNPGGQVVALGEGLETQFLRVDNGQVAWLSVDLPEAIDLRRRFIPDTERHRNLACSAVDFRWMDEVDVGKPTFITAAGLLMYLEPDAVRQLIAEIAGRFSDVQMIFDIVPRWAVRKSQRGWQKTRWYRVPTMPWGLDRNELQSMRAWHPNIREIRELNYSGGRGFAYSVLLPLFRKLPWMGNKAPSLVQLICHGIAE